ncbi:MAG: Hsp20/alpha crystallin family protein [Bacteroidetes bacterium]|nr:Hsp20/alpha crystallin family protein [Bacteroidota bacterium]
MNTLLSPSRLLPSFFDDDALRFPRLAWPDVFNEPFYRDGGNLPAVNIKDNTKSFDLELAVPGYKKEDLKVNVEGDVLTISSEKKSETEEEKKGYTRREYSYRSFSRSFTLPENADGDQVKASYENGVLKLSIPKTKALPEKHGKEVRIA